MDKNSFFGEMSESSSDLYSWKMGRGKGEGEDGKDDWEGFNR